MSSLRLVAVFSTVALMSCVSDDRFDPSPLDTPDEDGNDNGDNPAGGDLTRAKQLFDTRVYPALVTKCSAGAACHSEQARGPTLTRFVSTDAARGWQIATNYTALVGSNHAASNAPVLTLIAPGTHKGTAYTAGEEEGIRAWLDAEIEIRNGVGILSPPSAETLSDAAERVRLEFVACLTLPDFQAANLSAVWGTMNAQNNQQCGDCHTAGADGFIATTLQADLFAALTTNPALLMPYFGVDLTRGSESAKVVINTCALKGVAEGLDPHREHPRFNATNNQGMTALAQLYTATMQRKLAGLCNPPSARPW